jgi:hypothetical protein
MAKDHSAREFTSTRPFRSITHRVIKVFATGDGGARRLTQNSFEAMLIGIVASPELDCLDHRRSSRQPLGARIVPERTSVKCRRQVRQRSSVWELEALGQMAGPPGAGQDHNGGLVDLTPSQRNDGGCGASCTSSRERAAKLRLLAQPSFRVECLGKIDSLA